MLPPGISVRNSQARASGVDQASTLRWGSQNRTKQPAETSPTDGWVAEMFELLSLDCRNASYDTDDFPVASFTSLLQHSSAGMPISAPLPAPPGHLSAAPRPTAVSVRPPPLSCNRKSVPAENPSDVSTRTYFQRTGRTAVRRSRMPPRHHVQQLPLDFRPTASAPPPKMHPPTFSERHHQRRSRVIELMRSADPFRNPPDGPSVIPGPVKP